MFQFLKGAIDSCPGVPGMWPRVWFQFLKGAIDSIEALQQHCLRVMFQFLKGAIDSPGEVPQTRRGTGVSIPQRCD